jgi:hypothetical protein
MSREEIDRDVCEVVDRLVPVSKARILRAMERSREDVEFEVATLANLLTIKAQLCQDSSESR